MNFWDFHRGVVAFFEGDRGCFAIRAVDGLAVSLKCVIYRSPVAYFVVGQCYCTSSSRSPSE